jgi:hypothetical protein
MAYSPPPEFAQLYKIYTSDPDSMGKHLTERTVTMTEAVPLLVIRRRISQKPIRPLARAKITRTRDRACRWILGCRAKYVARRYARY